jgi:protein involved in polysaccharide export with SLBB domain
MIDPHSRLKARFSRLKQHRSSRAQPAILPVRAAWFVCVALALSACAKAPFTWASDIPAERAQPAPERKTIESGDVILVTVLAQETLSGQHVIGVDGTIAIPNIGTIAVAGQPVKTAEATIKQKLTTILNEPVVSIVVISRTIEVSILGEVGTPGKYLLKTGDGVANALALAGGLNDFGDEDSVYLVRSTEPLRVRFRLQDLVRGGNSARAFALRDGDLLVVE